MPATESALYQLWETDSHVIVRGLISPSEAESMRVICEDILQQWYKRDAVSGETDIDPDATAMRHLNHPDYFREHPEWFPVLMELVADERILALLRELFQEEPVFRCTSLFMNPQHNSVDGHWHRDSQFVTQSEAEEREFLFKENRPGGLQMQIALVPTEDAEVVPGSHKRWDTPEEYYIRKADGGAHHKSNDMPNAARASLQPGDAVIFNANALHRGRYHADKLRRTLMLTYVRESYPPKSDYFNRQPWFLEPGHLDGLQPRTREFFEKFIAAYSPTWQEQPLGPESDG